MAHDKSDDEQALMAGEFSTWIVDMQAAMLGTSGADVPCDGCTACCTSSQFVHISPDETDTLSHVPADLLFPAPRLPSGHVVLGYDERGRCPMLIDNRCSIYEHRPRACRTYDCRVFPAAGVEVDDEQSSIAQRVRRWQFTFPTDADRIEHDAVRAAASFLDDHRDMLRAAGLPVNAKERAVLAVRIYRAFLGCDVANGSVAVVDPDPEVVRAEIEHLTEGSVHRPV
ncbi:MAG TPA: YkgJ family cysteine cluster protein [Acidimicrobiales bacterium]